MAEEFDKKKLRQLARRDGDAVVDWFETFCDKLYTFVFYRVNEDPQLAGDVVRETFLTALRQISQFDVSRGSMFSWLTYLSGDCIKKALHNAGKEQATQHIWTGLDQSLATACQNIATEPIPEELLERTETAQLVQMTLASIPNRYSNILTDFYCKMNTKGQIAENLGKDELAITAMLYQGRLAFKAAFTRLAAWLKPGEAKG